MLNVWTEVRWKSLLGMCSGPKRRGSSPEVRRGKGRHSLSLQQVNLKSHCRSGAGGRGGFGEGGLHLVRRASTIQSLRTGNLGWAARYLAEAGGDAALVALEHAHRSNEKERLHTSHMYVRPRQFEQASSLPKQIPLGLWILRSAISRRS